jgi:DNA polymerase
MFVGEAPGEQEDKTGIPFVGAAGKLLDRYLYAVDLPRDKVYIANILKCRPPHNRDPEEGEQDACIGYLREQFRLIRPRVVVCLGRIAAMRLIRPDYRITREHGQWVQKGGVWMTAVYHPSALLRDLSKREDMLRDMWAIRQKLEELGVAPCVEDTANE